jgi:hypothetical protein
MAPIRSNRISPTPKKGIIMNNIHGLAQELLAIESETFEIDDVDGGEMALTLSACSSTTSSSCA